MALLDVTGLTINPQEASEISKLILEKAFANGVLSETHAIEMGIQFKTQIPFAGKIANSLRKSSGCVPADGTGVTFSEKFWEPEIFESRWKHCAKDLNGLFKLFQKASRINPDFYDKIDSQELGLIVSLIEQMINDNIPVIVWHSDKQADTVANGGVFKNGTDLTLYNVIDGLWKQIVAEINSGDANYVAITENAGVSYALQALPTDAGFNYLTKVIESADSRLLADPSAKILVTRSIADNYRKTLRSKTLGAGFMEVTENGRPTLSFDGYPIQIRDDWDREIKATFNNGTVLVKPHRVLFTTPDNIPIGTLSTDDFSTLVSIYDPVGRQNIVDAGLSLDAKFLESYMAVAAY